MAYMEDEFAPEWDYSQLITKVKRWNFKSKMRLIFEGSKKLVSTEAQNPSILRMMALPEELEVLTMLSIKENEWQIKDMTDRDYERAITAIRSFCHPTLFSQQGEGFAKWFMMLASANQFDFQANPVYRISRYISYFNYADEHIDMNSEVKHKFGLSYNEIAAPIVTLWFSFYNNNHALDVRQINRLYDKYRESFDLLTLTRDEYINELNEFASNEEDYIYCLRPSYSYPFISYDGVRYLPTPHLLIRSVTVSLMHRLTFGNDRLREQIGKYVLEPYLYQLISKSDECDEVLREQEYLPGQKTLDIMTVVEGNIVCFDSKSCTPQVGIRVFSQEAYQRTKTKIVKSFIQAYKHIRYKFGNEYTYLSIPVLDDRSNIYAVVVLAENPFCPLDEIHEAAADELHISKETEEYDWLRGHVGIVDLDALEVQILQRNNLMGAITSNIRSGRYSDHWFLQGVQTRDNSMTLNMRKDVRNLIKPVLDNIT